MDKELRRRPTENLNAYEDYLRGRFYWSKGTPGDYATALNAVTCDTSVTPGRGDRTIEVTGNDGATDSAIATTTVTAPIRPR